MHDEREQHAALQSHKDACVKMMRNASIRERKGTQGGRCRQCKAECIQVWTGIENVRHSGVKRNHTPRKEKDASIGDMRSWIPLSR